MIEITTPRQLKGFIYRFTVRLTMPEGSITIPGWSYCARWSPPVKSPSVQLREVAHYVADVSDALRDAVLKLVEPRINEERSRRVNAG